MIRCSGSKLSEDIHHVLMVDAVYLPNHSPYIRNGVALNAGVAIDSFQRLIGECVQAMQLLGSARNTCSIMRWVPVDLVAEILSDAMDPVLVSFPRRFTGPLHPRTNKGHERGRGAGFETNPVHASLSIIHLASVSQQWRRIEL